MGKTNSLTKLSVLLISLMLTSSQAINGVIPQMRNALGISQSQSELLGTAPSISVVICILLSSYVAKKIGMKKTVIIGLLLAGVGGLMPVFISNFSVILASRIILGAGLGLYNSLAVSYITGLYDGDTRANLLGFRNSMEAIGQTVLIFIAGVLLNISWTWSFAVYALAFPIALLFYLKVPDLKIAEDYIGKKEKMNPQVFALMLLAILLVMNSIAISVRFSSIATEIRGMDFNASNFLALMPILGIVAGLVFGSVNKVLGSKTMYVGIACFILSNLCIGFSGNSLTLLLAGLFISSIPGAWCFPYIFNNLDHVTTKNTVAFATSLIFIGCNIGNFLAPVAMQVIQLLTGSSSLTAPFFIFAILFGFVLIIVMVGDRRKNFSSLEKTS
ncbi:MFS transporter [Enterococcus sp. LJL90]